MQHDQESAKHPHFKHAIMTRKIPLLALTLISLAFAASYAATARKPAQPSKTQTPAQTSGASADIDRIGRIIAMYAKSVDARDTTLASQIWWDSPEVTFIHPLGHEHGFDQIKQNVYQHLMGDTFSERKLNVYDVSILTYGNTARAEFYWDFTAKFRKDDSPLTTHGRETQFYQNIQ